MKLQLFKNCKIDNIKRMSNFTSVTEQNNYYESLITNNNGIDISTTNYYKVGQPLIINYPYEDILIYNYGRFKLSDKWVYFSITDFDTVNENKTKIYFNIDCWETARYQYNVTLGKGVINRLSDRIIEIPQNIDCPIKDYSRKSLGYFNSNNIFLVIWYRDTSNVSHIYMCAVITQYLKDLVLKADLKTIIVGAGISSDDYNDENIINAWLSPVNMKSIMNNNGWDEKGRIGSAPETPIWELTNTSYLHNTLFSTTLGNEIKHTDTQIDYIVDSIGNIVYTLPFGYSFTSSDKMSICFDISPSAFNLILQIHKSNELGNLTGYYETTFSIMCERVNVFIDNYQSYYAVNREYEIKNRELTQEKEFYSSLTQSINAGGNMAISGGMVGGLPGMIGGFIGGTVGGLIMPGVNLGINNIYNPKFQELTDNYNKKVPDSIKLTGNNIVPLLLYNRCGVLTEKFNDDGLDRYNDMIANQGYKVDYSSDNCEIYYDTGNIQGDFEIIGNIPDTWKGQIRERFNNGVIVIQ